MIIFHMTGFNRELYEEYGVLRTLLDRSGESLFTYIDSPEIDEDSYMFFKVYRMNDKFYVVREIYSPFKTETTVSVHDTVDSVMDEFRDFLKTFIEIIDVAIREKIGDEEILHDKRAFIEKNTEAMLKHLRKNLSTVNVSHREKCETKSEKNYRILDLT